MINSKLKLSLSLILLFSVLLRVAAALYLGDQVVQTPGAYDQISYHNLALRLLDGHGFTFDRAWWPITAANRPTAHWSYFYTFYLAAVYALFGPHPLAARLIQAAVVGILHPLLAYALGRQLFDEQTGLLAATASAVYIYFIYYSAALMTEPFYITAILGVLYLLIRLSRAGKPATPGYQARWGVGLGLVLGITVLLRQLFILVIPILLVWLIWNSRQGRQLRNALIVTSVSITTLALCILPFTAYNYVRFQRFVPLNTNAGYAFFWANHPIYGSHFESILPPEMGSYEDLIPPELRHMDEAALDQTLLRRGLQFVLDDPIRYLRLSLSRIPSYFEFWPTRQSSLISNIARVGSFGVFLPFMLYGLILAKSRAADRSALTLILAFVSIYTAIHLLSWALIRYRLPVDALLLIFAGVALAGLAERIGQRRPSHTGTAQVGPRIT